MSNIITKGITTTKVTGFVLDENNVPTPKVVELEGALTKERAEGKARKVAGNILITSVEQVRSYYQLDRATAMENATDERVNRDDIQLGETGTTVYYLKLIEVGKPDCEKWAITFPQPMTQQRAFGAARRACDYDILPYASEQQRECKFISRAKFFELATPVENASDAEEDTEE